MHGILGLLGLIAFTAIYLFFPETSQPGVRGIDKMKEEHGSSRSFVFINPLRSLLLLRSPIMLLISIIMFASMVSAFLLQVPMPYTIGTRYHIKNEAIIGVCLLPSGIGSMVGATVVGRISDQTVIKWRRKRKGLWYPEDRLRAALIPFAIIIPLSVLTFGLVNKFVDGNLGLGLCLVCLISTGVGVDMTFGACVAYLVDVMHSRSSEMMATIDVLCSSLLALSVAAFLPMINNYGIALTNGMCAVFIWIVFGGLYCIIKYGEQMRTWMDIGFSTVENN